MMRQIRTFNLAKHVVDDMNATIRRGYRSQFVEDAIQDKLNRKANFDLQVRNTRFSSLTDLEKAFLQELWPKLKELDA